MIDPNNIYSFLGGLVVGIGVVIAFIRKRISPTEAQDIYNKTIKAISNYREAKARGQLTPDETIQIAEEALDAIGTFVKSLES